MREQHIINPLYQQPNDLLAAVGLFLHGITGLRAEWSMEISENKIAERRFPIFWIGQKGDITNKHSFSRMHKLLKHINCPENILALHKIVSATSITQGIGIATEDGKDTKCLYIHYIDSETGSEKKEAFKWNTHGQEYSFYTSHLFSSFSEKTSPQQHINSQLRGIFTNLMADSGLIGNSAFWYKYQKQQIRFVKIRSEVSIVKENVRNIFSNRIYNQLSDYSTLNFRHIGFSSVYNNNSVTTLYFSAPLKGRWPENFWDVRDTITIQGKLLHEKLNTE